MKIRTYKTKTYIDGWKLGQGLRGKTLVAIPENKLPSASEVLEIYIERLDGLMYLRHADIPNMLTSLPFRDKWSRGVYRLCYFEVKLNTQQYYFSWGGRGQTKSEVKNVKPDT